jgi:hypothetical protein
MTHLEKIQSMSAEELASYMQIITDIFLKMSYEERIEWLNSKVE